MRPLPSLKVGQTYADEAGSTWRVERVGPCSATAKCIASPESTTRSVAFSDGRSATFATGKVGTRLEISPFAIVRPA